MPVNTIYKPEYEESWAVVVGINEYSNAPLGYARQDAEVFASLLRTKFGFPADNVTLLLDGQASRQAIMAAFLSLAERQIGVDDRVVFFFAGHGCTKTGKRGEVGYLVPVDGEVNTLTSLIRWDDLTRNSELIPAKHILFIMDACYGGLAISRSPTGGSSRFLNDMLQRYTRQVLTAGKADQVVADSGGPRPGHSVFTGHLLNALEAEAADDDGVITANSVMSYVYNKVSCDPNSYQTPNFGCIDGDGDLVLQMPRAQKVHAPDEGADLLVQLPPTQSSAITVNEEASLADSIKEFLSDNKYRIRLDDLTSNQLRTLLFDIRETHFPLNSPPVTPDEFARRLRTIEESMVEVETLVCLVSRWGKREHHEILQKVINHLARNADKISGNIVWLSLYWYPVLRAMYCGGISALISSNYEFLRILLTTQIETQKYSGRKPIILPTADGILGLDQEKMFKSLPGYGRFFVPRSEYLLGSIQPVVEDLFFLGLEYEVLFDRFEILYALVYADLTEDANGFVWGPPGRFCWKGRRGGGPFEELFNEASAEKSSWAPLAAGFFQGSIERFLHIAASYKVEVMDKLPQF